MYSNRSPSRREIQRKMLRPIKSKNKKWTPGRSIDHLKPGQSVTLSNRQIREYLKYHR